MTTTIKTAPFAGLGLLLLSTCCASGSPSLESSLNKDNPIMKVATAVPYKVIGFDLRNIRLLDGPFKHAIEMDRQYLLALDADRLLHNFRVTAGIPSTAKPLGGWEAPDCELRGHFVGHYLSACAQMYASTGDERLRAKADYIVTELAKCQDKLGSGYLSAYPESEIDRVIDLRPVWAPWYTIHKIMAGLIDSYVYLGNKQALEVVERMADWTDARMKPLSDERMQRMLGNEQGGINEALANLYALTGRDRYLSLSIRFNHHAVIDPLAEQRDRLNGLHANTQIPKIIGVARQYELTGDEKYRTIASFFWTTVTQERSYVTGGNSDHEAFSPKEHLSDFTSTTTTETCNTYNMLKLTRHLFMWEPKAEFADYYERALFNHILASQDPDSGMMCYYLPLHSGARKIYNTPNDSFWCCTGTGVENHSKYGDSIWFHDASNALYLNQFIASELKWKERGITIRQETRFPDEAAVHLTLQCRRPIQISLRIRHPFWCAKGFQVIVNGQDVADQSVASSYAEITRVWRSGDKIDVKLPMSLRTESFKDNPSRLAFLYGPVVLSAATDSEHHVPVIVTPHAGSPSSLASDAIVSDAVTDAASSPNGGLEFRAVESLFHLPGNPISSSTVSAISFTPFFRMAHTNYVVYWDVLTPDQWQASEESIKLETERQREFESHLVDIVRPGEEQNERDHKLDRSGSSSGEFNDRKWRDARDGGWFSYTVKVVPGQAQNLVCTYWGSDAGGRVFDILVDGQKIAGVELNNKRPNTFYTETYPLTNSMVEGKTAITVRFQAHTGMMAGGLFELYVAKSGDAK